MRYKKYLLAVSLSLGILGVTESQFANAQETDFNFYRSGGLEATASGARIAVEGIGEVIIMGSATIQDPPILGVIKGGSAEVDGFSGMKGGLSSTDDGISSLIGIYSWTDLDAVKYADGVKLASVIPKKSIQTQGGKKFVRVEDLRTAVVLPLKIIDANKYVILQYKNKEYFEKALKSLESYKPLSRKIKVDQKAFRIEIPVEYFTQE
ncbi:MAG: hypothetical protein K0S08_2172 [Gammaproteobacteria bacterium]|jgi:hypothetical protein|nr:hypothetical protein [Gammaproteobacteria bacterium]